MSKPPPPPKPTDLHRDDAVAKHTGGIKKLNYAVLEKFESETKDKFDINVNEKTVHVLPGSKPLVPNDKIVTKGRRISEPFSSCDATKSIGIGKPSHNKFRQTLHAFQMQDDGLSSDATGPNIGCDSNKSKVYSNKTQVHSNKSEDDSNKTKLQNKPARPPPPSRQISKPLLSEEQTNNVEQNNVTKPEQKAKPVNRPAVAPRTSLINMGIGNVEKSQQPDRGPSSVPKPTLPPPPKPKRTFEHDIYMQNKALQSQTPSNINVQNRISAFSGKTVEGVKPSPKAPPPYKPPPPPWRASHPPSPTYKQAPSPVRPVTMMSDRSSLGSVSDYEYVTDWTDNIPNSPTKGTRPSRPRSFSSEDITIATRPKTVATAFPTSYEEPVYAEPSVAMNFNRSSNPTEHVYAEPFEAFRQRDERVGLVKRDPPVFSKEMDEIYKKRAHTLKPSGSAKYRSELHRRSSSLENGQKRYDRTSGEADVDIEDENENKKKELPWIQRKINEAFMALKKAKRGDKKDKLAIAETVSESLSQESADSDTENERAEADHRRRLRHAKSVKETAVYCTLDKIRAGMRYQQLFDCVVIVQLRRNPDTNKNEPFIAYQYPDEVTGPSADRLAAIPQFCFPDAANWAPIVADRCETFSFVLTSLDGSRTYGFCRRVMPPGRGPRLPEVYCILSPVGCFSLYDKVLDEVDRRRIRTSANVLFFLEAITKTTMPRPGKSIEICTPGGGGDGQDTIVLERPLDLRLEHVNFGGLLHCVSVKRLIEIFASMLLERRIIFTAKKLSTLSGCIHALAALLYPFTWQHAYIPVLPIHLVEMCCLPTPYMIGLLSVCIPELEDLELDEVLIVDLDNDSLVRSMGDEHTILPKKVQLALEKALTGIYTDYVHVHDGIPHNVEDYDVTLRDQMVSESFVRLFVEMVGHYGNYLKFYPNGSVHFQQESFQKGHSSKSVRKFLEIFMESQMFSVFIQEKEMEKMKPIQGTFDKRVEQYAEVSAVMQPRGFTKLGNRVKALGCRIVDAVKK
ncbi:DENN domain-containing protein 2C-like [Glandiceps talaboti]